MHGGHDIPIVKLTVDHMQHAIMQALDPELLANQLRKSADAALESLDFKHLIQQTLYRLTDEMLNDDDFVQPLRSRLYEQLCKTRDSMLDE